MSLHAIFCGGMDDKTSPSATDVEKTLAWAQPKLLGYVMQLGILCRIQVSMIAVGEISARIHHAPI
jgi:hypothetical protein